MKEKLVGFLKYCGWSLLLVVVVFISIRLVTIVKTISSDEPMNQELLPDTHIDRRYRKGETGLLEERVNELLGRVGSSKKLIQELKKKFQPPELKEVLLLEGEVDEFSGKVDEMKGISQQLQKQSQLPEREKLAKLQMTMNSLFTEFSEIQDRIQKLAKENAPSANEPP